jgi:hypothetical protein
MQSPLSRAERYQKVAAEYSDLAKAASSPFLRTYYQRTGEQYRLRAEEDELGKRTRIDGGVTIAHAIPFFMRNGGGLDIERDK